MALVMLVGVFSPLTALAAGEEEKKPIDWTNQIPADEPDASVTFKITTKTKGANPKLAGSFEGVSAVKDKIEVSSNDNENSVKFINLYSADTLTQNGVTIPTVKTEPGYRFVKWDKTIEMGSRPSKNGTVFTAVIEKIGEPNPSKAKATETVTLHKILMPKENFADGRFPGEVGLNGEKYTGNQVSKIEDYFGKEAKGAEGVFFVLKFASDYADTAKQGKYVKAKTELGEVIHDKPDYEIKVVDGKVVATPKATDNIDEAVSGITDADGVIKFYTRENKINAIANPNYDANDPESKAKLNAICYLDGKFIIDEVVEKSTYKNGSNVLTGSKAVPVEITLPLVNEDGVVVDAHVYPKNTDNAPKLDKNFSLAEAKKFMDEKEIKALDDAVAHKKAYDKALKVYASDSADYKKAVADYTEADKKLIAKWGIDFSDNQRNTKAELSRKVGDLVEYTVETEIPAQTKWATAKWDDKMTDGLTFVTKAMDKDDTKYKDKSIVVKYNGSVMDTGWYTLKEENNGFVLTLTEDGLKGINGKAEEATITLTYNAEVNKEAITDMTDSNDVTFHYGNKPNQGNTPIPTKPNKDGELTITKTWDDGKWADGESATFKLVDANTGKDVTENDVKSVDGYTFEGTVTLKKGDKETYTWKGLKTDRQYKAVEISSTSGSEAEYVKQDDGSIKVINHRSDNPTPLNPSEPKVVTGGKKFVKTDDNKETPKRLAGAEFYIKNNIKNDKDNNGKYLVAKKTDEAAAKKVTDAKAALDKLIKEYNEMTAEEQKGQQGTDKKTAIDNAQEAYNKAFKENAIEYTWGEKTDPNVVILTSDAQGRFEIQGLQYGDYKLEEKTAPKDFAKINDVDFTVAKGSYDGDQKKELKYYENETDTPDLPAEHGYGQQVVNKKVTIPQTGGIGTVIFTVVGIGLMAGAVMAMKKNREEA